jgi:hypothetical protein
MKLFTYLSGVFLCTLMGLIYGLLRQRHFKKHEALGWPVKSINIAWFDLSFYTALGIVAGFFWPFLLVFILVSFIAFKLGIK